MAQALCEIDEAKALDQFTALASRDLDPAWIQAEVLPWLQRLPQEARVNDLIDRFKQLASPTDQ